MSHNNSPKNEKPYELFSRGPNETLRYPDDRALLESYVELTENLIYTIQHFESIDGKVYPADMVMYLDKSARPVSWMVKEFWPLLAKPDQDGQSAAVPDFKYVNIDRLPWRRNQGISVRDYPDNLLEPTQQDIEGLRAIFTKHQATDSEGVMGAPTFLDGKRVLIVDEINDSGDTMHIAELLLSRAFPGAQFKTHAWMNKYKIAADGSKQVAEVPVWYKDDDPTGRLVADPLHADSWRDQGDGYAPIITTRPSETKASTQFKSSRPLQPWSPDNVEIKATQEEIDGNEKKKAALDALLANPDLSDRDRHITERQRWHLDFDTVDKIGRRRRRGIGKMALMISNAELTPFVHNLNLTPEQIDKFWQERKLRVQQLEKFRPQR